MGYIKGEDVRGYQFTNEIICSECIKSEELSEVTEDEILCDFSEEDFYFCDRCKKQM